MMHTDKFKSSDYFQSYIDDQKQRIDRFTKVLDICADSEKEKLYRIIGGLVKDLISAQFSNNESFSTIVSSFEKYAECLLVTGFSSYSEYVDFLSLQIILDISDVSIETPVDFDDDLTRLLNNYINKEDKPLAGFLCYPDYYEVFKNYLLGEIDFNELIDYVNNKWYSASVDFFWFGSHLREDNTYAGYWSYIASSSIRVKGDYEKISDGTYFIV